MIRRGDEVVSGQTVPDGAVDGRDLGLYGVHQWGWSIDLNPDGTATMTSPDKSRVFHSHGPPAAA